MLVHLDPCRTDLSVLTIHLPDEASDTKYYFLLLLGRKNSPNSGSPFLFDSMPLYMDLSESFHLNGLSFNMFQSDSMNLFVHLTDTLTFKKLQGKRNFIQVIEK